VDKSGRTTGAHALEDDGYREGLTMPKIVGYYKKPRPMKKAKAKAKPKRKKK
jgi:hypothetical protein